MRGWDNYPTGPARSESERYFGATVDARGEAVKKRYTTAYVLEWGHAVTGALTVEHGV